MRLTGTCRTAERRHLPASVQSCQIATSQFPKRVPRRELPAENTACGNVTCCEDCALIHFRECKARMRVVQRSVIAHVVKRTEYVHQYMEYIQRSDFNTLQFRCSYDRIVIDKACEQAQ